MSIMPYASSETTPVVRGVNAMTTEQLDELRAQYEGIERSEEAQTIVALLNEIDALDEALKASEDEVKRLRDRHEPRAVSGSVSRTATGGWRVRWRAADGVRRSKTFDSRHIAEAFLDDAMREGRR